VWTYRISDDNLHPNVEGQKMIADQILKEIVL
jgi:lysophospholipase L1-like esterase